MMKLMESETTAARSPADRNEQVSIVLWIVLILSMAGIVVLVGSEGWGQGTAQESRLGYQTGQVTAIQKHSIQINKKDYEVDESVTVKDDEDRTRELKDIKEGAEIQFHLRRDKIDAIILILPR